MSQEGNVFAGFLKSTGDLAKAAGDMAQATASEAGKIASTARKTVADAAGQAKRTIQDSVSQAGQIIVHTSSQIGDVTSHATTQINETFDEAKSQIASTIAEQDEEAERYAIEFLKKVLRLRAARIDREHFLTTELRKKAVPKRVIKQAIKERPAVAGISPTVLDAIAKESIAFETKKIDSNVIRGWITWRFCDAGHHSSGYHAILHSRLPHHAETCLLVRMAIIHR
ncbi:hypothetical protein BLEM_2052 [Bifidobacterium lemurum]|uniref:Uncharacterized protein n=1 Tax=Bifidobacterium lemurum TaxID=1603886 RepID=A0A261FLP8_9BIFI|nr:hypothetical protein [Bifidobacterium lemurum]OZG60112.1 hypothetical protein BLEM_2052 [Bifidobacterium lemurum]QOL34039.1 hypothetical protein BL8807_09870 [Bifidobacterium lemurum]